MRKLDQYLIVGGIVLSWFGFFLIGWFVAGLFHNPERTIHVVVTATPAPATPAAPLPVPVAPTPPPVSPYPGGQTPPQPVPVPTTNQPNGGQPPPPAVEPTTVITQPDTAMTPINTGKITDKTALHEKPELFGETLATVCEGDTVAFLDEQKNLLMHWYKVKVIDPAENCLKAEGGQQPERRILNYQGWVTSGNVTAPQQPIETPMPLPIASPTPIPAFSQYTIEQTLTAFKRAGLEAENLIPMSPADFGHLPAQPVAGMRFFIPSVGPGIGGKVFMFDTEDQREAVRAYYNELGQRDPMFSSRLFVNQNMLLQLDRDVPDTIASLYDRALANINNDFGLAGIAAEVSGDTMVSSPPALAPSSEPLTPAPPTAPPPSPTLPPPQAAPNMTQTLPLETGDLPEAPLSFSEEGDRLTGPFVVSEPYNRMVAQHTGSNTFTVYATAQGEQDKRTLFNATGPYLGNTLLMGPNIYSLEIYADGDWEIKVEPLAINQEMAREISGQGDMVSDTFQPPGVAPVTYRITHGGSGPFRLMVYCADSSFVVQDVTGTVNTEAPVDFTQGPCVWEIRASGVWRIEALP
jgi:hypothetical protein